MMNSRRILVKVVFHKDSLVWELWCNIFKLIIFASRIPYIIGVLDVTKNVYLISMRKTNIYHNWKLFFEHYNKRKDILGPYQIL